MKEWAKREVELACKRENPNWDGESFDYGCSCYQSALKAYNMLCDDGHSGYSFNITKNILISLMNGNPLSPITDEDFFYDGNKDFPLESKEYLKEKGLKSSIQCRRKTSLFRKETIDGEISYSDNDRCYCVDIHNSDLVYSCGEAINIINKLYPITMPYVPKNKKYKIYTEDFLTDTKNGDYDTMAFFYLITPENKKIELNIFKAEIDGKWVNITKEQYEERKKNKIKII